MGSLRHAVEVRAGARDFATGLLNDLVAALRGLSDGELFALVGPARLGPDLDRWARFTGNAVVEVTPEGDATRFLVRKGAARSYEEVPVVGSRLWLYTNFDCNLACDYCCVRSSPRAEPRALPLEDVQRAAAEAPGAGVREILVTGGEPFLRSDIAEVLLACAQALPTTVLTNGLLFTGKRRLALRGLPRDRVVLQISLDSPTPALHDQHRGEGTWEKARAGIAVAREEGFRVRLAATVSDAGAELEFQAFVSREGIPEEDCVLRRVALRGFADEGLALSRSDLVPEVTLTRAGVYWHPVGRDGPGLLRHRTDVPPRRGDRGSEAGLRRGAALRHLPGKRFPVRVVSRGDGSPNRGKRRNPLDDDANGDGRYFPEQRALAVLRVMLGAMFVWVFFENLGKGAYTPAGYKGVIDYYLKNGHAPELWKGVMAVAAANARIAAPMQALTELGFGLLLVSGGRHASRSPRPPERSSSPSGCRSSAPPGSGSWPSPSSSPSASPGRAPDAPGAWTP